MTSVAWADHDVVNQEEVDFSRDDASSNSYSDNDMWDSIKPNVIFDVDEHGNRLEVIKKVRQYVVERPARASDLRRKVAAFGKAKGQEKSDTIVSKEPQLALELGSADIFERESRAEIKRLIGENIADTSAKGAAKEENDADGEPGAATWGTNRATTSTFKTASAADVRRRIRVCNVSDDITEENLHNIFSANGAEVERVFLATDKETGNNKGYAFITFRDEKWVLAAVQQRRFNFKNVVLAVSHAMDKKI